MGEAFLILIILYVLMQAYRINAEEEVNKLPAMHHEEQPQAEETGILVYNGWDLQISTEQLEKVLSKRSRYFEKLPASEKPKFISRTKKFIADKIFIIHSNNPFVEMPILVSAAAVQVSFGMEKYLLPHFEHINIYPKEFLRTGLSICFLEGSVTGNSIHLSWKHILHGINIDNDGHDVALHEMAHAYYYQNFETTEHRDPGFINGYTHFINHGNKVFHIEKEEGKDLYSDYALKNLHEFWAVSVELFFEKPTELKNQHPELFQAIANMLQQTPYIC